MRGHSANTAEGLSEATHSFPTTTMHAPGARQQEEEHQTAQHPSVSHLPSAADAACASALPKGAGEDERSSPCVPPPTLLGEIQRRCPPERKPHSQESQPRSEAQEAGSAMGLPAGQRPPPAPRDCSSRPCLRPLPAQTPEAEHQGPLCGFVHFRFVEEEGLPVLYVYELQLSAAVQGQGLGSALISLLCKYAARVSAETAESGRPCSLWNPGLQM